MIVDNIDVTYRIGSWGLGATGLPRDNDLVYCKDSPRGLSRQLDCPGLGGHEIQNTILMRIQGTRVVLVL